MINKKDKEYYTNCGHRKDQDKKDFPPFSKDFQIEKGEKNNINLIR